MSAPAMHSLRRCGRGKSKIRCCGCFRRGAENAGSVFSGLFRASCRYGREAEVCGTFFPSGSGCPGRMPRNGKGAVKQVPKIGNHPCRIFIPAGVKSFKSDLLDSSFAEAVRIVSYQMITRSATGMNIAPPSMPKAA